MAANPLRAASHLEDAYCTCMAVSIKIRSDESVIPWNTISYSSECARTIPFALQTFEVQVTPFSIKASFTFFTAGQKQGYSSPTCQLLPQIAICSLSSLLVRSSGRKELRLSPLGLGQSGTLFPLRKPRFSSTIHCSAVRASGGQRKYQVGGRARAPLKLDFCNHTRAVEIS